MDIGVFVGGHHLHRPFTTSSPLFNNGGTSRLTSAPLTQPTFNVFPEQNCFGFFRSKVQNTVAALIVFHFKSYDFNINLQEFQNFKEFEMVRI